MSDSDSTPKMVSAPIRMSPELAEKVEEAKRLTGLAQADILRLCLAIGLEDLRRVGFDLAGLVSQAARPGLGAAAAKTVSFQAGKEGLGAAAADMPNIGPPKKGGVGFWVDSRGGVAAGAPIDAVNWEPIPVGKEYPEDHYGLKVFGDSMLPKIPDGSTVIVREVPDHTFPKQGTIVVYSDSSGSTLKVLGYRAAKEGEEANSFGKVPTLKALNPAYNDVQTMEGGRIEAVLVEVL